MFRDHAGLFRALKAAKVGMIVLPYMMLLANDDSFATATQ